MKNQIVVVVDSDGRILHTEQDGVFRRSNKQNELVALLPFPSVSTVKVNFVRADGVKPNSQYLQWSDEQEYNGTIYNAYIYWLSDYQLYSTGPLVASLDIINDGVTATTGDFVIDVEASEGACGADTPSDPNQYDEALKVLMHTDTVLLERTQNVPNLVADIQKVADNAFTYTNNSGVVSAPIVLGEGTKTPTLSNNASKVTIPNTAWVAQYVGTEISEYTCEVTAGLHGQMRDGATAADLWISFDETDGAALLGAFKRYKIDTAGNITVYVNRPVTLTVRVWNGKGGYDGEARAQIEAETERAETEEAKLQTQITELQNTGVDEVARADIAEETERAKSAEEELQTALQAEITRAKNAETDLQEQITDIKDNAVSFNATGWNATPSGMAYLGVFALALTVPTGKRIVQVLDGNNMPRGIWRGNNVYANAPFAGVAIII